MKRNIEQAIANLESTEDLKGKTKELEFNSARFKDKTQHNACCKS